MEAASAPRIDATYTRDGDLPVAPPPARSEPAGDRDPIDGVARCCCCERFPLVGERVVRHRGPAAAAWVCERCEEAGRGERIGPILGVGRIRTLGGAMNVRRAV